MTSQKQKLPSCASILSVLSIVFYCAGFLRIELELNEQKKRIQALKSIEESKSHTNILDLVTKSEEITSGKFDKKYLKMQISFEVSMRCKIHLRYTYQNQPARLAIFDCRAKEPSSTRSIHVFLILY